MPGTSELAYGVTYTPDIIKSFTNTSEVGERNLHNTALLDARNIKYIRVQFVDLYNNVRYRIMPRQYVDKLLQTDRPGFTIVGSVFGIIGMNFVPGKNNIGEHICVIDPASLRICDYAPGHASVMGSFQRKVPTPEHGLEVPDDPRALLAKVARRAAEEAGVEILVGFEIEFVLLKEFDEATGKPVPANNNGEYGISSKLPSGAKETIIVGEIADTLLSAGIELTQLHPEASPGQYEIITGPLPPVEAADAVVFTVEAIKHTAWKHGYRASIAPTLSGWPGTNARHTHISVHDIRPRPDASARNDASLAPTLSPTERSFLQGMLSHVPALCTFTLPTPGSYNRVNDGWWTGGTYVVWGSDNREAPIRLCGSPRGQTGGGHHFEIRCADGTMCTYAALASILAVGADAVAKGIELKQKDADKIAVSGMSDDDKAPYGIDGEVKRLPRSIKEAREALKADKLVEELLGKEFVDSYLGVSELLEKILTKSDPVETTKKILELY